MKKLLVLMLVLGMASIANATIITWSADAVTITAVGSTVVVQIVDDDGITHSNPKWVGYSPATVNPIGTISAITALAAAGGNADIANPSQTGYAGWWTVMSMDTQSPFTVASGNQYNVTISGQYQGSFVLGLDTLGTNIDYLNVTVLPEPTTVALLGLGGLLMLRRRK